MLQKYDNLSVVASNLSGNTTPQTGQLLNAALEMIRHGFIVMPAKEKKPYKIKSWNDLKEKPIHEHNAAFYFRDAPQIALIMEGGMEMIDVDLKYDLSNTIEANLLEIIKDVMPDVFPELLIERTQNNGLHIYYRCAAAEGNKVLAQRHATEQEMSGGEKVKVLIETRGSGGYSVCYPSPGYRILQGSFSSICEINPEQRASLLAVCRSFDEVQRSAQLSKLNRTLQNKATTNAPWQAFNAQHDYTWMARTLAENGFSVVRKDDKRIYILRDGSSAITSGSVFKDSNLLYLFSTSTIFEAHRPYTAFDLWCILKFDGNVKACAASLAQEGFGKWDELQYQFWDYTSNGKIRAKHTAILQWIHDNGYRKLRKQLDDFSVVRIQGMVVEQCSLDQLKKELCSYLKHEAEDVRDYFISIIAKLITKDGILSQLETCDESDFLSSTVNFTWVFYQNTALKISAAEIAAIPYSELPGLIWRSRIIDRNFVASADDGMTKEFIKMIAGEKNEETFRRCIGYLLHGYKDPTDPRVIILNDQPINYQVEEPRGGTGKGLFIQLLARFRNTYRVDGKIWKAQKNFPYQGVTWDTELIAFEDVVKGFDFESLFSVITDGLVIEKKGRDEFRIPFSRSPKMLITTNYAIPGSSSSHARRRLDLVLEPLFSYNYTPYDHFGKRFFDEWDEQDWQAFDNYMVNCVQLFVRQSLPAFELNGFITAKEVMEATSGEFYRWIENIYWHEGLPERIEKEAFLSSFASKHESSVWGKSDEVLSRFTRWLKVWCKFRGVQLDSSNRYNGEMAYRFSGELCGKAFNKN